MKKKIYHWHALYYLLAAAFYVLYYLLWSLISLAIGGRTSDIGVAMALTSVMLYVGLPLFVIFISRFSLIRLYVDPFIASLTPALLYCTMIAGKMKYVKEFSEAVERVNLSLVANGGEGLIFFVLLFVLGLFASFSVKRKNRQSISYRIIEKIGGRNAAAIEK